MACYQLNNKWLPRALWHCIECRLHQPAGHLCSERLRGSLCTPLPAPSWHVYCQHFGKVGPCTCRSRWSSCRAVQDLEQTRLCLLQVVVL